MAAGTFAVYAAGACRTIYVGDSGELVAAAATLGIPHPSGYPLYVLLGKLWTLLLPLGSIAWRMSLFSAACAAGACGLFYLTVRRLGLSSLTGVFSSLVLAFGPSFWSQANIQRVYALNALFLVAAPPPPSSGIGTGPRADGASVGWCWRPSSPGWGRRTTR